MPGDRSNTRATGTYADFRPIPPAERAGFCHAADQIGCEICVGPAIGLPYRKE